MIFPAFFRRSPELIPLFIGAIGFGSYFVATNKSVLFQNLVEV
jgi:hypothetical protein